VLAQTEEVRYFHSDAIGSVRLVTDANGQVVERYDYLPFGEPWTASPTGTETRRFGGKERDTETGLDYFGARYYASGNGRFTIVDPVMNQENALLNPQRWNRYVYALNNPFGNIDPNGREPVPSQWQMTYGADGFTRVLPAVGKAIWNMVVSLNSPGHISSPEAEARRQAQFMQPANTEEDVIMQLTDLAVLAAPMLRGASRASALETSAARRGSLSIGDEIGILRDAASGRGDFGLGSATAADAARLGQAWVGKGYTVASDGKTLLSANGLRQYRPPSYKPNLRRTQANFEQRPVPWGGWGSNGHLDILDVIP
jgi:RHS repeat-associated protein